MNSAKRFLWYHLPVVLYAAAIIAASSISGLSPGNIDVKGLDKIVHFIEYSVFAAITFRSFSHIRRLHLRAAWLLTALFVSVFAAVDEYYQSFVPGRNMDPNDLMVDIGGALLVATFLFLRQRRVKAAE